MKITIAVDETTGRVDITGDKPIDRSTLFRILHKINGGLFDNLAHQCRINPVTDAGGIERPRLVLPDFIEREA